jgi:peroxiredoxin Q/BCP
MLKVGTKAKDFTLEDQNGKSHTLSDYFGNFILIYFYPKDDTPGCTKEACSIGEMYPNFKKLRAKVFGISADTVKSHKKFVEKFDLPFTLLSDPEKKVLKMYRALGEKSMYGKKYIGILRTSYLIAPSGKIAKVYENVKPEKHADEVLADIKTLKKK